jgi:hypothetical protein
MMVPATPGRNVIQDLLLLAQDAILPAESLELEEKREGAAKSSPRPRAALPRSQPGAIPLWMPRP